jgi:hypothetical protein
MRFEREKNFEKRQQKDSKSAKKNPQNFQKRQHLRSKDGKPASPGLNGLYLCYKNRFFCLKTDFFTP